MQAHKPLILVVDDDLLVLKTTARALSQDFNVMSTHDPAEAVEMAKRVVFAAVVSDVSMPRMNGFEFKKALLEAVPSLTGKVIFLSGGGATEELREQLQKIEYVEKPCQSSHLIAAVRKITDAAHAGLP